MVKRKWLMTVAPSKIRPEATVTMQCITEALILICFIRKSVPQGCILGTLLLLVYYNNIVDVRNAVTC